MTSRRLVVLVLVGALLALQPMAQASPPDPTWIAGLYDDAGYDDVVLLVTDGVSDLPAAPVSALAPVAMVVAILPPISHDNAPEPPRLTDFGRAPPLS